MDDLEMRMVRIRARCKAGSESDRDWFNHLVERSIHVVIPFHGHLPPSKRARSRDRLMTEYVAKGMEDYFRGIDLDLAAAEYEEIMASQGLMDDK